MIGSHNYSSTTSKNQKFKGNDTPIFHLDILCILIPELFEVQMRGSFRILSAFKICSSSLSKKIANALWSTHTSPSCSLEQPTWTGLLHRASNKHTGIREVDDRNGRKRDCSHYIILYLMFFSSLILLNFK